MSNNASNSNNTNSNDDVDLDELLQSSLDDFERLQAPRPPPAATPATTATHTSASAVRGDPTLPPMNDAFAKDLADLVSLMEKDLGLGESNTTTSTGGNPAESAFNGNIEEVLKKLSERLETSNNADASTATPNMLKQFMDQMDQNGNMQTMMEDMVKQLMSKDLLYEPLKEMCEKYPEWLQRSKATLSPQEYDKYTKQYEYMKKICRVYENSPEDYQEVLQLMQDLQEFGQPPTEIVSELAPGVKFDENGMPVLPDAGNPEGKEGGCTIA